MILHEMRLKICVYLKTQGIQFEKFEISIKMFNNSSQFFQHLHLANDGLTLKRFLRIITFMSFFTAKPILTKCMFLA